MLSSTNATAPSRTYFLTSASRTNSCQRPTGSKSSFFIADTRKPANMKYTATKRTSIMSGIPSPAKNFSIFPMKSLMPGFGASSTASPPSGVSAARASASGASACSAAASAASSAVSADSCAALAAAVSGLFSAVSGAVPEGRFFLDLLIFSPPLVQIWPGSPA